MKNACTHRKIKAMGRLTALFLALWLSASATLLFAQSLEEGLEAALPGLLARLESGELQPAELSQLLISHAEQPQAVPPSLAPVGIDDAEFIRVLGADLQKRVEQILATNPSSKVLGLKRLSEVLLPANDEHRKAIARVIALAERAEHLSAVDDAVELVSMREEAQSEADKAIIEGHATRLLEKLATRNVDRNKPAFALRQLAQIDPHWRTETAVNLVRAAVTELNQLMQADGRLAFWPFDDRAVDRLVTDVAEADPSLLTLMAEMFSERVIDLLEDNDVTGAVKYYDRVMRARPDPNEKNDTLRLRIAGVAMGPEGVTFARGRVEELEAAGKLSFFAKMKLLFTGFYGIAFPAVVLVCLVSMLFFGALAYLRPDVKLRRPQLQVNLPRSRRRVPGYQSVPSQPDEYSRLLALFDLDDTATEEEIKRVYRQKMKEHHPDAGGGDTDSSAEKFMDLKVAYERILEIKRSRFGR